MYFAVEKKKKLSHNTRTLLCRIDIHFIYQETVLVNIVFILQKNHINPLSQ
jgi:hypothetical protein